MLLSNERETWLQRVTHVASYANQLASGIPSNLPGFAIPSAIEAIETNIRDILGRADDSLPEHPVLSKIIKPMLAFRDGMLSAKSRPIGWSEVRAELESLCNVARAVQSDLMNDEKIAEQSVAEVVRELNREIQMSMLLSLTSNYALSQKVNLWREQRSGEVRPGDHLEISTLNFVDQPGKTTVSMHTLADNSTGEPVVLHTENMAVKLNAMMDGEDTPPAIYRMSYRNWFTSVQSTWEDVYRQKLADAHNRADPDASWRRNDIKSEFFDAIRRIRNDISHHNGMCIDSHGVKVVDWLSRGEPINPSPTQMMRLLEQFPEDDLNRTPVPQSGPQPQQLRYNFDAAWVKHFEEYVSTRYQTKAERSTSIQKVLDDWMNLER